MTQHRPLDWDMLQVFLVWFIEKIEFKFFISLFLGENCKKKCDDLLLENVMLKKQNEDLVRRNIALQDALVSNTKVIPPVPFEAKVKKVHCFAKFILLKRFEYRMGVGFTTVQSF